MSDIKNKCLEATKRAAYRRGVLAGMDYARKELLAARDHEPNGEPKRALYNAAIRLSNMRYSMEYGQRDYPK